MARIRRIEDPINVELIEGTPPFVTKKRRRARGRKGVGLRYERRAQEYLQEEFGFEYVPSPWFRYSLRRTPRAVNYAQPDGLLIEANRGTITIVEIKYSHCAESYFQLMDKYLPLAQAFFGEELWKFSLVEVVRWYDRDVQYPTQVRMREHIEDCKPTEIGVHIYKP